MKTLIKWAFKILAGLFVFGILGVLAYYGYYKWRQASVYEEKITVTAYYMKYGCGECSVDMKVQAVDNQKYSFIIGQDIYPRPKTKKFKELCDFIGSIGFESSTGPDYIEESFTLIGHLHKNSHGLPIFECSEAPFFTVDKIKYGTNGKWKDFLRKTDKLLLLTVWFYKMPASESSASAFNFLLNLGSSFP